jgi:hypothetical protein
MQELKKSRRLVEDKVDLRFSNEAMVAALVVGTSYFVLLKQMILELYNCYFVLVF